MSLGAIDAGRLRQVGRLGEDLNKKLVTILDRVCSVFKLMIMMPALCIESLDKARQRFCVFGGSTQLGLYY